MERKHSVWLIVLIVLLIAALAAVVVVKNKWDASKDALVSTNERLMRELENTKALSDQLAEQEQQITEKDALLTEKDAQLAEKDTLLAEKEVLLIEKDELLTEKDAILAEQDEILAERDAELMEKDSLLAAQAQQLAEKYDLDAPVDSEPTAAPVSETAAPDADPEIAVSADRETLVTGLDKILLQIAEISAADDAVPEEKIAALSEVETALADYAEQLTAALDATDAEQADLESELETANAAIEQLNAEIEENARTIAAYEAQLAEVPAAATGSADADDLQKQLAAEKQRADALTAQLQAALAEYGSTLTELRLYKLEHDPEQGSYYAATALAGDITVAADGVTAAVDLTNSILSANSLSLELLLDDEVIAASEALVPGEKLSKLTLSRALAAGEYEATAMLTTCSAEGETLSRQRIPVRITVAE